MNKLFTKENIKKSLFFLIPCLILIFIYLSFYPGIYTGDGDVQWAQVSSGYMNNAHPFLSTYFIYLLSKIWNSNSVLFVFQIIILTIVWGNILLKFYNKKNYKLLIIYSILFSLCPIISLYSISAWKDVLYSYYLLALVYYLYIGLNNNYKYSKAQYFIIGLLLFMIFNYRINGMIVATLLFILFYILLYRNRKNNNFKYSFIIACSFIILNLILLIPKNYYINKYNEYHKDDAEVVGTSVLDSYYTWIMGSHINKGYVSDDDLEFLNNYINVDEWKSIYDPFLINSTNTAKSRDNSYVNANLKKFRSVFYKYLLKHPFTVIEHYLKADVLLWSPFPLGYVYQYDFKTWGPDYSFNVYDTSKIKWFNKIYESFTTLTMRRPIRVWFYQPAFMLYLSIILILILVNATKNKKYWMVLMPMLCNILSLIPINLAQDLRYVYINYLTISFALLLFLINFDKIKKYFNNLKKKKEKIICWYK